MTHTFEVLLNTLYQAYARIAYTLARIMDNFSNVSLLS